MPSRLWPPACSSASPRSRTSSCSFEDCRASITLARPTTVAAGIAVDDEQLRRLDARRRRQSFPARRFAAFERAHRRRAPRRLAPTSSRSSAANRSETRTALANRGRRDPACADVRRTSQASRQSNRAGLRRRARTFRLVPPPRIFPVAAPCFRTAAAFEIASKFPSHWLSHWLSHCRASLHDRNVVDSIRQSRRLDSHQHEPPSFRVAVKTGGFLRRATSASTSARIRTPCAGFGDRLLSQEHTRVSLNDSQPPGDASTLRLQRNIPVRFADELRPAFTRHVVPGV